MNPLSWPNVQKRQSDFDMTAGPDEIKLIYVQGGSATITDADGKSETASPGQMVMVYDGSVRWTVTPDSGPLTLLSSEGIEYSDEEAEQAQAESDALQKPPDADLSLPERAGLLAGLRVVPPRAPSTRVAHSRSTARAPSLPCSRLLYPPCADMMRAAGLLSGALIAFGVRTFTEGGG